MVGAGDNSRHGHLPLMREAGSAGNRAECVRQLYAEHGEPLMSYVLRLTVGDRHLAEDIVQETLLRAWRNADTLTPERGSVRGWLMRVAHNITVDVYRATRSRPTEVPRDATAEAVVTRDLSDDVLTALEVKRALSGLTPKHRAVLMEVYFKDRTAAEAARTLGIPVGTVKSRIHYALRVLRVMFDEKRE